MKMCNYENRKVSGVIKLNLKRSLCNLILFILYQSPQCLSISKANGMGWALDDVTTMKNTNENIYVISSVCLLLICRNAETYTHCVVDLEQLIVSISVIHKNERRFLLMLSWHKEASTKVILFLFLFRN